MIGPAPQDPRESVQPIPFKMFGLQRTGTNLMVALMLKNFHVHSLESVGEWKHGPLLAPDRQWNGRPARFILCVKNPCAWALSCYRYFQRALGVDRTVAPQFRADPSISFADFVVGPTYGFPTVIHRWNLMYRLWLNTLPAERTALVRQEDQLRDQISVMESVERKLGLSRRAAQLEAIVEKVDVNAKAVGPMNATFYLERRYLNEYSPALLAKVNDLLDRDLVRQFGYEVEK